MRNEVFLMKKLVFAGLTAAALALTALSQSAGRGPGLPARVPARRRGVVQRRADVRLSLDAVPRPLGAGLPAALLLRLSAALRPYGYPPPRPYGYPAPYGYAPPGYPGAPFAAPQPATAAAPNARGRPGRHAGHAGHAGHVERRAGRAGERRLRIPGRLRL